MRPDDRYDPREVVWLWSAGTKKRHLVVKVPQVSRATRAANWGYGWAARDDAGRWVPHCADCDPEPMPPATKRRDAVDAVLRHRRSVHNDDLVLIPKWNPFRAY